MSVERSEGATQAALDALFASAAQEGRTLTATEVMRTIGLKRTSINVTYPHINERRKAHNLALKEQPGPETPQRRAIEEQVRELQQTISELRTQLRGESERSEQYAQVIRQLALDNHELRLLHPNLSDARGRFNRAETADER